LCIVKKRPEQPSWDHLFEIAGAQAGHFTTKQAAEAGYSSPLLFKHIRAGRIARTRRGVYRLVHFPAGEHEELIVIWLWSEQTGVVSHQTALALHGLSDALPAHVHLTLPSLWRRRRFRVPADVVLHHADVPVEDRAWFGAVPATNARRSLNDCAREGLSPELLRQAAQQALRRGLVVRQELGDVEDALAPFGGLSA
jgi:predicted transcriptional regulator of viral defense system